MKICLSFIAGAFLATLLTIILGLKYKLISFDKKNGFSEVIPQKMNRVHAQGRYNFSYKEGSNSIHTYKDGKPFLFEGDGDIFGLFDDKGLVFGGEIPVRTTLKNLDFVLYTDSEIYVFKWHDIHGIKYKR